MGQANHEGPDGQAVESRVLQELVDDQAGALVAAPGQNELSVHESEAGRLVHPILLAGGSHRVERARQKHESGRRGPDDVVLKPCLHFAQKLLGGIARDGKIDDARFARGEIGELLWERLRIAQANTEGEGITEEDNGGARGAACDHPIEVVVDRVIDVEDQRAGAGITLACVMGSGKAGSPPDHRPRHQALRRRLKVRLRFEDRRSHFEDAQRKGHGRRRKNHVSQHSAGQQRDRGEEKKYEAERPCAKGRDAMMGLDQNDQADDHQQGDGASDLSRNLPSQPHGLSCSSW